ncbi:MAG: serine/threonine protein kinase, partial [Acidobacteriota bacterium]
MSGKTIGKYQILSELPPGSFGPVYLGRLPGAAMELEIRKIPLNRCSSAERALLKARIRRAAWVQHQLKHPVIVRLLDSFADNQSCYLVAEHVAGTNLRDLLQRQGLPTLSQALSLTRQALGALDYAHHLRYFDETDNLQSGLLHRDLKPASLILDSLGRLRITEFGVANLPDNPAYAYTGLQPGTLDYLAPELRRGSEPDPKSDIFSLGVIIYEMLTGYHPYRRSAPRSAQPPVPGLPWGEEMEAGPRISYDSAPPSIAEIRREVDPRLSRLLMLALDRRPSVRYPSAAAFLKALQEYEAGAGEVATGELSGDRGWKLRRRGVARSQEPVVIQLPGSRPRETSRSGEESLDQILAPRRGSSSRYGAAALMILLLATTVWIWLKDGYRLPVGAERQELARMEEEQAGGQVVPEASSHGSRQGAANPGDPLAPSLTAPPLPSPDHGHEVVDKTGGGSDIAPPPSVSVARTGPLDQAEEAQNRLGAIALLAAAREADQNGRFDQALGLYEEYLGRGEMAAE